MRFGSRVGCKLRLGLEMRIAPGFGQCLSFCVGGGCMIWFMIGVRFTFGHLNMHQSPCVLQK